MRSLRFCAVVFCALAALVSFTLLARHVTGAPGPAWFEAGCGPPEPAPPPPSKRGTGDGLPPAQGGIQRGTSGCKAVLASPYSYFPPKRGDEPTRTVHIPVAFLGLVYFSTLGVWLIGVGRPSYKRRWFHAVPTAFVGFGLVVSARYTYIMYAVEEWCPWCLATHLMNVLIAACVVLLWPRRAGIRSSLVALLTAPRAVEGAESEPAPSAVQPSYPSWWRVCGTLGAIVVVLYGNYGQFGLLAVHRSRADLQRCLAAVSRIQQNAPTLVDNWKRAKPCDIPIRDDDPIRTAADRGANGPRLVVFSDFLCPSCARFAVYLDETIKPLFDSDLTIVFKHYPLDASCNPQTRMTAHPGACAAARLAEAARQLAGNEAFWKAHDFLFERQSEMKRTRSVDAVALAAHLGVDPTRLQESAQSAAVTQRIAEDASAGKACGVHGTPAVFLDGKRVDPLAIMQPEFWKAVAQQYRATDASSDTHAAGNAGNGRATPTPDTRDRKGAP